MLHIPSQRRPRVGEVTRLGVQADYEQAVQREGLDALLAPYKIGRAEPPRHRA